MVMDTLPPPKGPAPRPDVGSCYRYPPLLPPRPLKPGERYDVPPRPKKLSFIEQWL